MAILEEKKTSLARLKRLLFGCKTEKADKILSAGTAAASPARGDAGVKPKRPGHGRKGGPGSSGSPARAGAPPQFKAGDLCPQCLKAKPYLLKTPELVYEALIDAAADGRLLHNDDTPMRVQSLRAPRAQDTGAAKPRTGVFTTSIISQIGTHRAALFFTGANHAGENLDQLLKRRSAELEKPLQMCDALSRNPAKQTPTQLCHCLLHGRRNFVDVIESFPEACRKVIESLREIYRVEALAKESHLSDLQRLTLHQEHSRPVLNSLHQWMTEQIDQKKVEPNSGLGQAIAYMLKHWEPLTRFLHIPGAPLDNKICNAARGITDIMPPGGLCRAAAQNSGVSSKTPGSDDCRRGIIQRLSRKPSSRSFGR